MFNSILFILLVIFFLLVYFLLNKFYFKEKNHGVANDSMRFLAFFFDMMMFNMLVFGLGFFYFLFRGQIKSHILAYIDDVVNKSGYGKLRHDWLALEIKLFILYLVYSIVMEIISRKGTFGKQFVKIEFESKHSIVNVIIRNLLKPISLIGWPIAIIGSKMSGNRIWFHDVVCKVKLVVLK